MKKAIISLMLALPFGCLAETLEVSETIAYSGTLANQSIFMTLSTTGDRVLGSYFYTKYKTPISLHGSVSGSRLSLIEKAADGEAYIDADIKEGTIIGEWEFKGKTHKVHAQALSRSYETIVKEINILEQGIADKVLSIDFRNGKKQNITIPILEQSTLIIFEDFTFDGYPDMRILEIEAGGNSSFIYFEYDAAFGRYVTSSKEIAQLVNPRIFHSEKTIISVSRDGCCIYHAKKILPEELHSASYDYESRTGGVTIIKKTTGQETTKSISEKHFDADYLNFMGFGALKRLE